MTIIGARARGLGYPDMEARATHWIAGSRPGRPRPTISGRQQSSISRPKRC